MRSLQNIQGKCLLWKAMQAFQKLLNKIRISFNCILPWTIWSSPCSYGGRFCSNQASPASGCGLGTRQPRPAWTPSRVHCLLLGSEGTSWHDWQPKGSSLQLDFASCLFCEIDLRTSEGLMCTWSEAERKEALERIMNLKTCFLFVRHSALRITALSPSVRIRMGLILSSPSWLCSSVKMTTYPGKNCRAKKVF